MYIEHFPEWINNRCQRKELLTEAHVTE